MLLHISGSEVTEAARKSEDIENDIAKVAPFDKGEHGSFAMRDRIMTSEQLSNEKDVKQKLKRLSHLEICKSNKAKTRAENLSKRPGHKIFPFPGRSFPSFPTSFPHFLSLGCSKRRF